MRVTFISYFAEYIGTFFFVLSIFASGGNPLIIGASLALVIFLIESISDGHVNPAVSFAKYMDGTLRPVDLLSYIVAQILGGISAFYAYKMSKH
jgi:glycerol uptake facilitator-like aquaporin